MIYYRKLRQSRKKRLRKRKTRRLQRGGNTISIFYRPARTLIPIDDSIKTWGQLKQYHKQMKEAITSVYDDDDRPLEDRMDVMISEYFEPEALVQKLLSDERQDFGKISRERKKFAVSTNGGGFDPSANTLQSYNEEEKAEFLHILSQHYGFRIGYVIYYGITLYDEESANILLECFKEEGIFNDIGDINEFYRVMEDLDEDNKMHFIHILFGEIRGYQGIEPASNNTVYHNFGMNTAVMFEGLPPTIQMIIAKFYSMFP